MADGRPSITIRRGNRLGKPIAVYADDGKGGLARTDYASAKEARAAAATMARKSGWRIVDRLDAAAGPSSAKPARKTLADRLAASSRKMRR